MRRGGEEEREGERDGGMEREMGRWNRNTEKSEVGQREREIQRQSHCCPSFLMRTRLVTYLQCEK